MKYIMLEQRLRSTDSIVPTPIIFPDTLTHVAVEQALLGLNGSCFNLISLGPAVSAGFITLDPVRCFGASESLGLLSNMDEDTETINYTSLIGTVPPQDPAKPSTIERSYKKIRAYIHKDSKKILNKSEYLVYTTGGIIRKDEKKYWVPLYADNDI